MKLPVSIIIPTYNEGKYLPKLLKSIRKQTMLPEEIIVSDASSEDNTRAVAQKFGCKVVEGGLPAKGRNNGAKAAKQPILLFLDADVVLPPDFLEKTVREMMNRNLDVASCYVAPITSYKIDHHLHEAMNYYMRFTKKFYPHAPGFCIFVRKWTHEDIKGFDESIVMAEDHDYVKRAKKIAQFGYLRSYKIPVSVRRLEEDGRLTIAMKYIGVELHRIFLGEIKKDYFSYRFGQHYYEDK